MCRRTSTQPAPTPLLPSFTLPRATTAGITEYDSLCGQLSAVLSPYSDPTIQAQQSSSLHLLLIPLTNGPRNDLVASVASTALQLRALNPQFWATISLMATSLLGYEKETQHLERKMRAMQGELDAMHATMDFGRNARGHREGSSGVPDMVRDVFSSQIGGFLDTERSIVGEEETEKQLIETVLARDGRVDLDQWPLPPSKKKWNCQMEGGGERKRKRKTR